MKLAVWDVSVDVLWLATWMENSEQKFEQYTDTIDYTVAAVSGSQAMDKAKSLALQEPNRNTLGKHEIMPVRYYKATQVLDVVSLSLKETLDG